MAKPLKAADLQGALADEKVTPMATPVVNPVRQRIVVEAVPDEKGGVRMHSHIEGAWQGHLLKAAVKSVERAYKEIKWKVLREMTQAKAKAAQTKKE